MNLGAEPKKVAILGALLVAAAVGLYMNMSGDSTPAPAPRTVATSSVPAASPAIPVTSAPRDRVAQVANGGEFRARIIGTRPDDKLDPASIDPELRLDLLAKVQAVEPIEAGRNLFQFGTAPAPPPPLPKDVPKIPVTLHPPAAASGPLNATNNQPPPKPQAPPITFKYYGYKVSKADLHREAFLLDGDDIIFAQENQIVKQHYKVLKIAMNSITIEDTQANNTQTLTLQDLPPS